MRLYYKSNAGHTIDFDAGPLAAQQPETLTRSAWGFETISGVNGLGRIRNFYKETWDASLVVTVTADTVAEFNSIMTELHETFEKDVRNLTPGRLYWGDYYRECYAIETSQSNYDEMLEYVEKTIRFVCVHPFWIKEKTTDLMPSTYAYGGIDFNSSLDLRNLNLGVSERRKNVTFPGLIDCNFILKFFGPVASPYVWVGDHRYAVDVNVGTNETLTIDSKNKTIILANRTGVDKNERNVFYARDREYDVFRKIPANTSLLVRWPITMIGQIRIISQDERGEPTWI